MGVWKGVNDHLGLLFSNTMLNDDQNLWAMPTMKFISMVSKSNITSCDKRRREDQ